MKKLILLSLLLFVCSLPAFAQQDDYERYRREQRESLRGLDALTVSLFFGSMSK